MLCVLQYFHTYCLLNLGCKTQWPPDKNPVLDKYPVKTPAVENYVCSTGFYCLGFKPQSKNPVGFNILVTHFLPTFPPPQVQVYFPRDGMDNLDTISGVGIPISHPKIKMCNFQ